MWVMHFSPVWQAQPSERVRGRGASCLACLAVLAAALLGYVLPQAASAERFALSKVEAPSSECGVCMAIRVPTVPASSADATGPDLEGSGEKGGLDPKDLREAYELPETGGSSQTVAIVDAYNDPYAESDLQEYRKKYKVYFKGTETACTEANHCFTKINQKGETKNYPENNSVWSGEISLDLDMVSAACPQCHILLVEASSEPEELSSLITANEEAAKWEVEEPETKTKRKATEVTNSWGGVESSEDTSDDKYFDHPGLPTFAAAGDVQYDGCDHKFGAGICYPAASQYVIAVGGVKLKKTSETWKAPTQEVWKEETETRKNGTGSGCSKYEPKLPGQKELPANRSYCEHRLDNDVSADAAVESAVSVCDSYISGCWENFGGTSASSPFVAGVEAHATSATQLLGASAFYKKPSMLFDVTKGSNGTCTPPTEDEYFCTAEVGYDAPTGEGTPNNVFTSIVPAGATGFATKVKATEVTLNGIVNPNGATTKYYFQYGTTESYGKTTAEESVSSGTSDVEESKAIIGLAANTKYYVRIVTTNSNGTTDGLPQTLVTASDPHAETKPASSVSETGATLNGIVNPEGAETKYYFEYGPTTSYGTKTAEASAGAGTSNIEESKAITGLVAGTTYDFRIVATNGNGTVDGANLEFKTLKGPSVETKAATGITAFEATLNGSVDPNGYETKYYFEYGTTESYGTKTAEASAGSGTSSVEESKTISGLQSQTAYDFRIVATNSGGTVYGANQKFATLESTPVVVTDAATSITDMGGTLKGTVNPEDKEAKYYFEYGKTVSYGTKTAEASAGSGKTAVEESSAVTGLEPEVTYHYRIVATNSFGTSDGTDHTFTTLASSWLLQTTPNVTGSIESFLGRVSCSSSTAWTAVGEYVTAGDEVYAFAERWNGTAWSVQSTPSPAGAEESYLQGVSCTSSTACTATGGYYNSEGKLVSLAESWNGTEWKIQTVPSPSGAKSSVLHVVSCKSSTECTAVGRYENSEGIYLALAERWNGTEWKVQTVPNPTGTKESLFKGVSCTSSTACTADGWYVNSSGATVTLAESWNGTEWKVQTTPNETGATSSKLSGISCTSSTACEANGWYVASEGHEWALAESWNGTEWKVQTVPKPTEAEDSILSGVSCFSSTDCTASGTYENLNDHTLAEHWNGTEWKVQTTLNVTEEFEGLKATQPTILEGVSCPTATICVTTGIYQNDSGEPSWETMAEKSS
jgi:hypothetical protein